MIEYKKRFGPFKLKYGLTYFDEPYNKTAADIVLEWQYSKKKKFSEEFHTLFTNLGEPEETILSHFEKNTKYEIKRAKEKDGVIIETLNPEADKQLFYDFYNAFALTKKLPPLAVFETDLLVSHNMLVIRSASCNNNRLVFHSYVCANGRARLLHSASLFRDSDDSAYRNLVGRANRLLHWDDICYFKNNGYTVYDWGGVGMDAKDQAKQAINSFKRSFGGEPVKEYKSQIPQTLRGFGLLVCKKLLGKI